MKNIKYIILLLIGNIFLNLTKFVDFISSKLHGITIGITRLCVDSVKKDIIKGWDKATEEAAEKTLNELER